MQISRLSLLPEYQKWKFRKSRQLTKIDKHVVVLLKGRGADRVNNSTPPLTQTTTSAHFQILAEKVQELEQKLAEWTDSKEEVGFYSIQIKYYLFLDREVEKH